MILYQYIKGLEIRKVKLINNRVKIIAGSKSSPTVFMYDKTLEDKENE